MKHMLVVKGGNSNSEIENIKRSASGLPNSSRRNKAYEYLHGNETESFSLRTR